MTLFRSATGWAGSGWVGIGLVALVGWPMLQAARLALQSESAAEPAGALGRSLGLAIQTVQLVALTELMVLPLGVALAWLIHRTDLPGRSVWRSWIRLALFVPLPLLAMAWLGSFGNLGRQQAIGSEPLLRGMGGAAFVHAVAALPWVVMIVGAGFMRLEPELEEASLVEQSGWRVFWSLSLPRSWAFVAAAALAVAILTAGEMTVTDLIPLRTYAEEAYTLSQLGLDMGTLVIRSTWHAMLLLAGLALAISPRLVRRVPHVEAAARARPVEWKLGAWRNPCVGFVALVLGILAILPLYGLVWRAGRVGTGLVAGRGASWSWGGLGGTLVRAWVDLVEPGVEPWRTPLWGSLLWAALSATMAVGVGWPLAWLARGSRLWRVMMVMAATLMLATPGPVAGLVYKVAYARVESLNDTPGLLILAQAARTLPYVLLVLWPAVHGLPRDRLDIAATAGYGPWRQLWHVAAPATRASAGLAWLLSVALALGELPVAYFVQAPGYQPLSVLIWGLLHVGVESRLAGIGLIVLGVLMVIGLAALAVASGSRGWSGNRARLTIGD